MLLRPTRAPAGYEALGLKVVYSGLDIPLFETLPPSQPRRNFDLAVIAADDEGLSACSSCLYCLKITQVM